MKIYPAIDIYGGKAVRLYKGDYSRMTVYSEDPLEVAATFKTLGAGFIHTVDLEGAEAGEPRNFDLIVNIKLETGLFCEVGGGIRSFSAMEKYIESGIDRVILGTAAAENTDFLREAVLRFGDRIALGIDIKDGFVATRGWKTKSDIPAFAFFETASRIGVKTVICTDVSKDGVLGGSNIGLYNELSARFPMNIIASGGVSDLGELMRLKALGIYGAIIGKAYYTGAIDLGEAIRAAESGEPAENDASAEIDAPTNKYKSAETVRRQRKRSETEK